MDTRDLARRGAQAAREFLSRPPSVKDEALGAIARRLEAEAGSIVEANRADLAEAERAKLPGPLLKRLRFDRPKLDESLAGVRALGLLPDPVGRILEARKLDEGLVLRRVSCPIGLIGMIFESRPDALVQMACLAAKSGNAVILKGGREAANTNRALAAAIAAAGVEAGLPESWLSLLETREEVGALLELDEFVDLLIPRGSKEFVRSIMDRSRIPVMGHSDGVCHVYVHEDADPETAVRVAVDSKAQYPAACNAAEVLLVHSAFARRKVGPDAATGLERLTRALEAAGVAIETEPPDWSVEYLDLRMAVKTVESLDEAIAHINRHGSGHTDAIVATDRGAAERFMNEVDSASVYWNASTRFADGFRYGLGAEVGISTGKLHARGPVGLEGLVTYKWKLSGSGQVVADYASGRRAFVHENLEGELGSRYAES
jgi:glutamate-5-semialdehyde dehydrogenase